MSENLRHMFKCRKCGRIELATTALQEGWEKDGESFKTRIAQCGNCEQCRSCKWFDDKEVHETYWKFDGRSLGEVKTSRKVSNGICEVMPEKLNKSKSDRCSLWEK